MDLRYNRSIRKIVLVLIGAIGLVTVGVLSGSSRASITPLPGVMLWVWDRAEDVSALDCQRAGVAILDETITLTTDLVRMMPRSEPATVPDGCATVAVVRIDAAEGATSQNRIEPIGRELLRIAGRSGLRGLQVDFNATASQRSFLRALLHRVRDDLPDGVALLVVAPSSWCLFDNWIDDLPIDDAVPVLFDMDGEDAHPSTDLKGGTALSGIKCQQSLGVSVDDPPLNAPVGRRLFVSRGQPWSSDEISHALAWAEGLR